MGSEGERSNRVGVEEGGVAGEAAGWGVGRGATGQE